MRNCSCLFNIWIAFEIRRPNLEQKDRDAPNSVYLLCSTVKKSPWKSSDSAQPNNWYICWRHKSDKLCARCSNRSQQIKFTSANIKQTSRCRTSNIWTKTHQSSSVWLLSPAWWKVRLLLAWTNQRGAGRHCLKGKDLPVPALEINSEKCKTKTSGLIYSVRW